MSKTVFENFFTFSRGRRNRKSYLFFHLAVMAIYVVLMAPSIGWVLENGPALERGVETADPSALVVASLVALLVAIFPLAIAGWAVSAQRFRDCNVTGWCSLLMLVPYL